MKFTTYKLMEGKPISWQLPLTEVLIEKITTDRFGKKISEGLKRIKFVPGVNSFFTEDLSGDLKPQQIWFTKGELTVPNVDKVQNALLKAHPWYGKKYKLYSEKEESLLKLEVLRASAEATRLIDEADGEKIRAIALGVFGQNAFTWDEATAELNLREYAKRKPKALQAELKSKGYESKYLAALAFSKGIIKEGIGKTSVIWNDTTEGLILKLAKGESGVHKLGEFLSYSNDQSLLVIQEIGDRLEKMDTKTTDKDIINDKDDEIAKLKEQLRVQKMDLSEDKPPVNDQEISIEEARDKYFEVTGKKVPNVKKNDLNWIISKLK